jgi:nicotinate dehydrogenase subunit A
VADSASEKSSVDLTLNLTLNGQARAIVAEATTPLLYALRNDLGLTGSRFGCGVGQCGACHVLVDGVSVPSCDTSLASVHGKSVVTIEGLAEGGILNPLQQAFVDEQAAQCGYCLSGILISAAALLKTTPNPSEDQIRTTLDPHLCRCGSHNRIVRAVLRAAETMRATE